MGRAAVDRLVTEHLWIVHDLARRHPARSWAHRDLVAAGYLGLVKAARNFEEGDFRPYASTAVRREMLHFLKECAWPVRLPRTQRAPVPPWCEHRVGLTECERGVEDPKPADERISAVMRAMDRLPEPWRRTMRDCYLRDRTIAQEARAEGITTEGVRARLRKGRRLLREAVAG